MEHLKELLRDLELHLVRHTRTDDSQSFALLQTVPGIGVFLALVILYEIRPPCRSLQK